MGPPRGGGRARAQHGDREREDCQLPSRGPEHLEPGSEGRRPALEGHHALHDPEQPVEILRTIHSFDPCIDCAMHLADDRGEELFRVKVR
jgi:hydrogenase large subunit